MKKLLLGALVAAGVSFHAPAASACHIPNPEIWWCYFEHFNTTTDPVACPVIASVSGAYGAAEITAQGDIYVAGEFIYDCPPYEV